MNLEVQKLELIQLILSLQDGQLLAKIEQLLKKEAAVAEGSTKKPTTSKEGNKRQYGFAKGMTLFVAEDFDETPPGFEEYMPQQ